MVELEIAVRIAPKAAVSSRSFDRASGWSQKVSDPSK